ncbi:MAG: hypothetical protein Q9195_000012 [Heterodermia aff. obscurata]
MPPRSLLQMAQKACIKDVKYLESIGGLPLKIDGAYAAIKPVLWAVDNADQLHLIEQNSPQIVGDDAELWIKLIQRDVEKYADQMPPRPQDPKNWYNVYKKLLKEHQRTMAVQTAALKATMADLRDAKRKKEVQSKDKDELPKLPKLEGMQYLRLREWNMPAVIAREKRSIERKKELADAAGVKKNNNIFCKLRQERRKAHRSAMSTPTHLLYTNLLPKEKDKESTAPQQQLDTRQTIAAYRARNAKERSMNSLAISDTEIAPRPVPARVCNQNDKPKIMKQRAPADIFIPTKRRRLT